MDNRYIMVEIESYKEYLEDLKKEGLLKEVKIRNGPKEIQKVLKYSYTFEVDKDKVKQSGNYVKFYDDDVGELWESFLKGLGLKYNINYFEPETYYNFEESIGEYYLKDVIEIGDFRIPFYKLSIAYEPQWYRYQLEVSFPPIL